MHPRHDGHRPVLGRGEDNEASQTPVSGTTLRNLRGTRNVPSHGIPPEWKRGKLRQNQ